MLGADVVEYMANVQRPGAIGGPLAKSRAAARIARSLARRQRSAEWIAAGHVPYGVNLAAGNYVLHGTEMPSFQLGADPSGKDKAFGFAGMVAVALAIGAIYVVTR